MQSKYIENGIHHDYRVLSIGALQHFAIIVKPDGFVDLGRFPTKKDAVWAAKQWLQMRFGGGK